MPNTPPDITYQVYFLSAKSDLSSSAFTQQAPGFLSGLFCGFLFFWCHYSFFLFFPVTFTFFRHDVSPDNRMVIINLLTNASYALDERYPGENPEKKKLEIKARCITIEGRDILRTTITDWGSGIEQDVIDHIFDTLFTTKPPGKGTGLGLSISKGIVRDHRGTLSLKSKPGGPTVATMDLPVGGSCNDEA